MTAGPSPQPAKAARAARTENGASAAPAADRSLERALGVQIRALRRQHDLSVSDLAGAAGISTGMLSKIENGQISPSLSTLHAIALALSTPVSSLFATFEERQDCSYVPAGQGVVIERRGSKAGHVYRLLGHAIGGATVVEPFLIELKEDAAPFTGFQHAGAEFVYMLTGEVVYRHGDRTHHLKPGDAVLFDSGALHGPETLVSHPITYLSVIIYPRSAS